MKLKTYSVKLINIYQKVFSPVIKLFLEFFGLVKNNSCVFYPSCSEYTKERIEDLGLVRGVISGMKRITICR